MTLKVRGAAIGLAILLGTPVAAQEAVAVSADEITGDAAAGERVFRRCQACHMVGADAENKVGPVLNGVVGRPAAALPDFEYSDAMTEAGAAGMVWTVEELLVYLENPRKHVPGTNMAFAGLRSEEQRADVIAYLHEASEGGGEE